jgi:hypothetical protein
VGLAMAAVLGTIVRSVSREGSLTRTEWLLVSFVSAGVALATALFLTQSLKTRWRSVSSVGNLVNSIRRTLLIGLIALGGFELASHGLASLLDATRFTSATLTSIWIGAAAIIAAISAWRRR